MATYTVGEAAKAAGVTARAVRLYEAKGLVSESRRSSSGYRLFNDEDVETLAFVRRARSLSLSLDAIAEIIDISRNGAPCERTRALLGQRVAEIDATMADLLRLRETIAAAQGIECGEGIRCAVIEGAVPA